MRITALLMPPRFDEDEKTREAFLLHVILWALIVVSLLFLMYHLLFFPEIPKRVLAQVFCSLLINAFLLMLVRRGNVRGASIIQIMAFWLFFSATAWTRAGVPHQAYQIGYPLVISIAGFLVGLRGALIMVALTLLSGGFMVAAEDMSWWSFRAADSGLSIWVVSALLFPVFAILQYLAARLLRTALVQSRMSQAQYRNLFEHIPQRIFIKDLNSVYLSCNALYARDLGIQREQIHGKNDFDFYPKDLAEEYRAEDRAVTKDEVIKDIGQKYVVSGHERWVHIIRVPYRDHQGHVIGVLGIFEDITDRRRVEDALRASEARHTLISDNVSDSIWLMDMNFKMTWASRSVERNRGYNLDELRGLPLEELLAPASLEMVLKIIHEELTPERLQQKDLDISKTMDLEFRKKDGTTYWNEVTMKLLRDQGGTPIGILGVGRDIEHRRIREALRESEEKYRLFVESAGEGIVLTQAGEIKYANPRAMEFVGYSQEEMLGKNMLDFVHPDDRERITQLYLLKVAGEDVPQASSWRVIGKSGAVKWIQSRSTLLTWEGKRCLLAFLTDIDQQKRTEEALQASEEKYKELFEDAPVGYMEYDNLGIITKVNRKELEMLGYTAEEMVGELAWNFVVEKEKGQELIKAKLAGDNPPSKNLERTYIRKDGTTFPGLIEDAVFKDGTGRVMGIRSTIQDITERKGAEEEQKKLQMQLANAVEMAHLGHWECDVPNNLFTFNDYFYKIFRTSAEEVGGYTMTADEYAKRFLHPDDLHVVGEEMQKAIETTNPNYSRQLEHRILYADGTVGYITVRFFVVKDSSGRTIKTYGVNQDITERKRAEEEKERLQAQLLQAQKMESVGRLAGGVAHDFNNMLQAILGHAEMASMELEEGHSVQKHLKQIRDSAQRSAAVVSHLLAFARKQTASPRVLNLNDTVSAMLKMLRRLIGEEIDLTWTPGVQLWGAKIDPSQVDQILVNLVVNARDAIAGVGRIAIETGNVVLDESHCAQHPDCTPGGYVLLAVSDNGGGMSKEVLGQLFEPFFTTKEPGKGTGLGLSTIYGIVKQNNGCIEVASEPEKGASFKIYLPRFEIQATEVVAEGRPQLPQVGMETVLLVEDEEAIRTATQTMLERLGYKVLSANTPNGAMRLVDEYAGHIHLLLTDVVMPEMNGLDLAEKIGELRSGIKHLFMSGYTADVIAHHGVLDKGVRFMQKPFSLMDLAAKVREALDGG